MKKIPLILLRLSQVVIIASLLSLFVEIAKHRPILVVSVELVVAVVVFLYIKYKYPQEYSHVKKADSGFKMRKSSKFLLIALGVAVLLLIGLSAIIWGSARNNLSQNNIDNGQNKCANVNTDNFKKQAQNIENDISKYASTSKDITDKSSEGGQQVNYTSGNQTVLVKQTFYGETGKSEVSYYLENGNVFYFIKKNSTYVAPLFQDPSGKVGSVEVKDFYLGDGHNLCSWFDNGKIQSNDQDTKDLVNYLVSGL